MDTPPYDRIVEDAVSLAETWQNRANALLTAEEKGIAQQMKGLVTHPPDKVVLTQLIDQSFRTENTARVADQINYLLAKYALITLEPGESWALKPENIGDNPYLWTPGIKWGVQPGSYTHTTEFFGPLLGVMQAQDLDHSIEMVNQTGYGLTSGLESLDPREQKHWKNCRNALKQRR